MTGNVSLAGAGVVERIVAIVNDEVILLSELDSAFEPLAKQLEASYKDKGDQLKKEIAAAREEILNKLIERKILLQEAKARGIEADPQEVNGMLENIKKTFATEDKFKEALEEQKLTPDQFSRRIEDELMMKRLVDQEVKLKISVGLEEMQSYYETNKNIFFHDRQYRIRHILIKESAAGAEGEIKAREALEKIKNGEDFSIVARGYSEDPTAASGGELGFMEKDKLIPEIRELIETLKIGEISGIVKTRLGYQIIKLEAIKEAEAKNLDEVKEEIRQRLFQEKFATSYKEWLDSLKQKSYIYIKKESL